MAMAFGSSPPANAVRLSEVEVLTLRAGEQTAHGRVDPIPQLRCTSHPDICALHKINILRCTNQGSSYSREDVQWTCTAALPSTLALGSTDVICEGYSSPSDSYILKGSCGVEYQLALTSEGKKKHPSLARDMKRLARNQGRQQPAPPITTRAEPSENATRSTSLFELIALALTVWLICKLALSPGRPTPLSGQGPPSPPPIPPMPPMPPMPPIPPFPHMPQMPQMPQMPTPQMCPSASGLFSAFATGAATGYMARGARQDHATREQTTTSSDPGATTSASSSTGSSGPAPKHGTSAAQTSSSFSHMSTGFGSTRRRTPGTWTSEEEEPSSSDSETLPPTPSSSSTWDKVSAPESDHTSVGVGSTHRR